MAARLTRVFCACACWDAAHQSETPLISSRAQNSPSTSRRPPLLAGVLRRESSGGAASPHFDVVNERQRPPRDDSVLLLWRSCQGSSHGRGPCSDFGPLSLPSDSQRPTLRAGWEARVRPLWDAGQMMGTWTLQSAAGLHFRGVFPPGCSPAPFPLPLSPISCT